MFRRFLLALCLLLPFPVGATVTTTATPTITYTGDGSTKTFTYSFPATDEDWIVVTFIDNPAGTEDVYTQNVDYTVSLGTANGGLGSITLTGAAPSSPDQVRIERIIDVTQETSLRNQGFYNPSAIEDALDKLTMIIQQIDAQAGTDGDDAVDTHEGAADPHGVYFLLAGRSGGQTGYGSQTTGEDLQLIPNSVAADGQILFGTAGTTCFDDANNAIGIGTCTFGTYALNVSTGDTALRDLYFSDDVVYGGTDAGDNLTFQPSTQTNNGTFRIRDDSGVSFVYDPDDINLTIGDSSVSTYALDVDDAAGFAVGETDKIIVDHDGSNEGVLYIEDGSAYDNFMTFRAGLTDTNGAGIQLYGDLFSTASSRTDIVMWARDYHFQDANFTEYWTVDDRDMDYGGQLSTRQDVETVSSSGTVTVDEDTDCNKVWAISVSGVTFELPTLSVGTTGCTMTFVVDNEGYTVNLSPASGDGIRGTCIDHAGGTHTTNQFDGTDALDVTCAGCSWGETITITALEDGDDWYATSCFGEWDS